MESVLIFGIVLISGIVALIILVVRPPVRRKGGEELVARTIGVLPEGYVVLNDVTLPTVDGITTQADHLVISRFGIFVIETKDYDGWIFGEEKSKMWTESFYGGRTRWGGSRSKKFRFQNPIRQNWRHIYVLSEHLKLPVQVFHSAVVFCGNCEFKTPMPQGVMYRSALRDYILSFDEPIWSPGAVENLHKRILAIRGSVSEEQKAQHVKNLHRRHNPLLVRLDAEAGQLKCPRCGSTMVLRRRRSDNHPFYGCRRYPDCKGTVNA